MATRLVPGDRIEAATDGVIAGAGTYVHGSHIQSSLYGERHDIVSSDGTRTITARDKKDLKISPDIPSNFQTASQNINGLWEEI